MSEIDKINQQRDKRHKQRQSRINTLTTALTCIFILVVSFFNYKLYNLQEYLTITISNALLVIFIAFSSTQARRAIRKYDDAHLLLLECDFIMVLTSAEINELKFKIKKLKRIIDEQNNNVGGVRPSS